MFAAVSEKGSLGTRADRVAIDREDDDASRRCSRIADEPGDGCVGLRRASPIGSEEPRRQDATRFAVDAHGEVGGLQVRQRPAACVAHRGVDGEDFASAAERLRRLLLGRGCRGPRAKRDQDEDNRCDSHGPSVVLADGV